MPAVTLVCLGFALVALALVDVFYTVLFPARGHGPLRERLATVVRWLFGLTRHLPSAGRRRRVLAYAGPVQIALTLLVWFSLLLVGWAAVYRPALGSQVVAASGQTQVGWGTALYVSGFSLTTLGTGDVVATTTAYRLFTVVEAATGFVILTLVISYFNSVYTTLSSRHAFAMALHHRSGGTGRGDRVVAALWQEGDAAAAVHLAEMASSLRQIAQTHRAYPVLRAFHSRRDYDTLPRMLLTCLETSTLLRSSFDPDLAGEPRRTPLSGTSMVEIHEAARGVRSQLLPTAEEGSCSEQQRRDWVAHHAAMTTALRADGVPVRTDPEAAAAYVRLRTQWDPELAVLAQALLYDWPEGVLAPSTDPRRGAGRNEGRRPDAV